MPAWPVDALQEVSATIPMPTSQCCLVDDLSAVAHRSNRALEASAIAIGARLGDPAPLCPEMLEISFLKLQPAFLQHLKRRITPGRRLQTAFRNRQIQPSEVTAAEVAGEVTRRELESVVSPTHINLLYHSC